MKITKQQIKFLKSYVSDDHLRPLLQCVYFDWSTLRAVATNGFVLGTVEVKVDENITKESFYFPYEHLEIAGNYLKHSSEFVEVVATSQKIVFITPYAEISINKVDHGQYPDYKKILKRDEEKEYVVKVSAKLLKKIADSHLKLGQEHITVQMNGTREAIYFKDSYNVDSLLMPVTIEDKEKGKLQK